MVYKKSRRDRGIKERERKVIEVLIIFNFRNSIRIEREGVEESGEIIKVRRIFSDFNDRRRYRERRREVHNRERGRRGVREGSRDRESL